VIETLVGSSLAAAAGLNAWIPLLVLGLLSRFTDLVPLPATWQWLSSDLALWIVGALLVVEIVADKIPALDTVNDIIHTAIRPAAGGIVFGAGASAEALTLDDSASWGTIDWGPVITGVVIALVVHGIKATATGGEHRHRRCGRAGAEHHRGRRVRGGVGSRDPAARPRDPSRHRPGRPGSHAHPARATTSSRTASRSGRLSQPSPEGVGLFTGVLE